MEDLTYSQSNIILRAVDLKKHFPIKRGLFSKVSGYVYALDGISFSLKRGETLGIVGESGSGKSTLAMTVLKLHDPTSGEIFFEEKNITKTTGNDLKTFRRNIQVIFQDPFDSLNPYHSIGYTLEEPFIIHGIGSGSNRKKMSEELLRKVGLEKDSVHKFPHEFSGGQRQRIGIARAIALNPKVIICDEPVSSLDVSIQTQVLNLLLSLQKEMGMSYIFISHNIAVVKIMSDYIAVMYLGKIVEMTNATELYQNPCHPYTKLLIDSIPITDPKQRNRIVVNKGELPSISSPPKGCVFCTRCPEVMDICLEKRPDLKNISKNGNHDVACHLFQV